MLNRRIEEGLFATLRALQVGCIVFSPLHKGILSDRYLKGIGSDTRAAGISPFLTPSDITPEIMAKVEQLNRLAAEREQSLAQMALAWTLRDEAVTSTLIGASKVSQIEDAAGALSRLEFTVDELTQINSILSGRDEEAPLPSNPVRV